MQDVNDQTPPEGAVAEPMVFRDESGELNRVYVDTVAEAIEASDAARLRELLDDVHESDLGDLIEALAPDERPRLIELLGADFDFTALTEVDDAVREEILEELE